jgi:hypothetical protein
MTSIITGDIVNSTNTAPKEWMTVLKNTLQKFGSEPVQWEVYRGDSFQLEVAPNDALSTCVFIKSSIKQLKEIDVRMAIGIGEKSYAASKITESNGTAFTHSGQCFEQLKKRNLAIKSSWGELDDTINLMIELFLLTADKWASVSAKIVNQAMLHQNLNQTQLAEKLGKSQSAISEALQRAGYDEVTKLIKYYEKTIQEKC